MSDAPLTSKSATTSATSEQPMPNPWQCLGGAVVAGVIAFGLYLLTGTIAHYFATKGVQSDKLIVQRLSAAIRTLVVGMSAMGAGIFGVSGLGLFGLGLQLLLKANKQEPTG